jgi:DNA repair protein RecO (recombination protein O)
MEWTDEGLVLARRRHGETSAIVSLFTRERGRHLGLVRGGAGSRGGGLYQPGNRVVARWRARLEEHLGGFSAELAEGLAARVLDEPGALAALAAATAVLEAVLPERAPYPVLYADTLALARALGGPDDGAGARYVRWEAALLAELGFGLDLESCAATGVAEGLEFVSPRSGRAVSAAAGKPWADRLMRLPRFLADESAAATPPEIAAGLALTGHFLERHLLAPARRHLPAARVRLAERWARAGRSRAS